jgi:hypothetical protein
MNERMSGSLVFSMCQPPALAASRRWSTTGISSPSSISKKPPARFPLSQQECFQQSIDDPWALRCRHSIALLSEPIGHGPQQQQERTIFDGERELMGSLPVCRRKS